MVDDYDWNAIMDSEIFREYVSTELRKEAKEKALEPQKQRKQVEELDRALTAMDDFESQIKKSSALLNKFRQIKSALLSNEELIEKTDPNFVKGIMMLDLEEDE